MVVTKYAPRACRTSPARPWNPRSLPPFFSLSTNFFPSLIDGVERLPFECIEGNRCDDVDSWPNILS